MTNPLSHALDDASNGPQARRYTIPVELVRRRAGRRRAFRRAATAATTLVLVAGTAGAVYAGLSERRANPPVTTPTEPPTAIADFPAQFLRCGQAAGDVLPDVGGLTLRLDEADATVATDGTWHAVATAELPGASDEQGWVWGTDLTVLRDGVVVGVQDGAQVPDVADIDQWLGGSLYATEPFPLTGDVALGLASCDQYPSGTGSPNLEPGTYDLVVTQTISYGAPEGGTRQDARTSTRTTVTITDAAGVAADPTACGSSDDELATIADPQSNPAPFEVQHQPRSAPLDSAEAFTAQLVNVGSEAYSISTTNPTIVFVRDGVVVGATAIGVRLDSATLGPGESVGLGGFDDPRGCRTHEADEADEADGDPLPAGEYQAWVVVDVHVTAPTPQDVRAAGGPWPLILSP